LGAVDVSAPASLVRDEVLNVLLVPRPTTMMENKEKFGLGTPIGRCG
jgi:hypothetical protein